MYKGISVKWHQSPTANNITSDPKCYQNKSLVTRNCVDSQWTPSLNDLDPCLKVVKKIDLSECPPGFRKLLDNNSSFCYKIEEPSSWNFPCFFGGGASVITDLTSTEIDSLLQSLTTLNISKYYWLPAHRQKLYNPVVWYVPGPNWGRTVRPKKWLSMQTVFLKSCLLLDIERKTIITESCNNIYPSLCFYINDFHYPAKCPHGYHGFRLKPDSGTCFGIEQSDSAEGSTFYRFLDIKCKKPMHDDDIYNGLTTFIFKKIAKLYDLPDDMWCWFKISFNNYHSNNNSKNCSDNDALISDSECEHLEGAINNIGMLGLLNKSRNLPCMACEADVIYEETELIFEYNNIENKIYLTVYYPSGLWKYSSEDIGIQCFSNANGFVGVINVNGIPFVKSISLENNYTGYLNVEKVVYIIDLITERTAQYWCQGHTKNLSLITTDKIVVNPVGNEVHVFSLITKYYFYKEIEGDPNITSIILNLTDLFQAESVLFMDILQYSMENMLILLHVHVAVKEFYEDQSLNLIESYNTLKKIAEIELPQYNFSFVNISSSLYCLPTTSEDSITLEWEMTPIGHIAAPKQLCLQSNGLPVKRRCEGSYLMGSTWNEVEGYCDSTYKPSTTTKFLYQFVNGQVSNNYMSRFLTDGLGFVLDDIDIFIPADIYYLSLSLQQFLQILKENKTSVDLGNIENTAWAMDRMMILNCKYLRLAQTLNSTNVILNSINIIIEFLVQKSINESHTIEIENRYQLAIQPKYIVQVSFPYYNNITGIAISRNLCSDEFTDVIIKPLYKNTSLDEVLSIKNLEVATWVPIEVLNTLKINNNYSDPINAENINVIINIFHNDALFQELTVPNRLVNSRIIGLTIPGFMSNLEYSVPLIFRELNHSKYEATCVYWDFQSQKANYAPGSWKKQGCYLVKNIMNVTVCECYHLTHFGQLLNIHGNMNFEDYIKNKYHTRALNIITLVGCFLSLVGIVGIWVTALVFSNWRKKASTKILLQLSTAIALPLIFIVIFNLNFTIFIKENGEYSVSKEMKSTCIILGALLHYSILASFMWMLITAILQFVRYVQVLGVKRPSRFMCKFNLIGWGIPIIPVVIILLIDTNNYIPDSSYHKRICYPTGIFLILGVLVPICLILTVNIILFILVLYAISCGTEEKVKSTDMDLICTQLRLSIFLFFLLGLTWIFGILSFSNNFTWSYLFCLTSTLQGFVLFVYFIICDPSTRNLWVTLMKPQVPRGSTRNSIISLSTIH